MECDRGKVPVNFKKGVELSDDWRCEFQRVRVKPSTFNVIGVTQDMLLAYKTFFTPTFKAICHVKSPPICAMHILDTPPPSSFSTQGLMEWWFSIIRAKSKLFVVKREKHWPI